MQSDVGEVLMFMFIVRIRNVHAQYFIYNKKGQEKRRRKKIILVVKSFSPSIC